MKWHLNTVSKCARYHKIKIREDGRGINGGILAVSIYYIRSVVELLRNGYGWSRRDAAGDDDGEGFGLFDSILRVRKTLSFESRANRTQSLCPMDALCCYVSEVYCSAVKRVCIVRTAGGNSGLWIYPYHTNHLHRRCVPYLVMTGVTIFVIASSLKVSSDQLYVYLPTCINVGIVLGNGIDHAWSIVVKGIKRAWTGACRSIVQLLNTLAEQEDEFEDRWNREGRLPVFEDRTRGFAEQQRRVSIEVEDASPEDEPPSRSTQQAPLALPSGFSITADDSNPW